MKYLSICLMNFIILFIMSISLMLFSFHFIMNEGVYFLQWELFSLNSMSIVMTF